jgi:hypothetical protein
MKSNIVGAEFEVLADANNWFVRDQVRDELDRSLKN